MSPPQRSFAPERQHPFDLRLRQRPESLSQGARRMDLRSDVSDPLEPPSHHILARARLAAEKEGPRLPATRFRLTLIARVVVALSVPSREAPARRQLRS